MAKDIKSSVERIQRAKTDIASAIAGKGVTVPDGTKIDGMPELILHIETGTDTSDATATANDIVGGKTAYVNGEKVVGEIKTLMSAGTTPEFVNGDIRMPYGGNDRLLLKKDSFFSASADKFGDAAAENVLKGKKFTSSAGLAVVGTLDTPSGGIDTSDATATADNIEYGKTAYTANGKEAGTLNKTSNIASTKTSVTAERKTPMVGSPYYIIGVSADELTAPSSTGRYIIDAAKLNVSMDVNASVFGDAAASNVLKGKTFTSSAGLAVAGTHVCKQPNLQTKSVTPSAAAQTVQPDSSYDGLSSVAVSGDANLTAANIKKGVNIFGVAGTHECPAPKLHEKQITPSAEAKTYYPNEGYDGISKISVVGDPDLSPENIVYGKQVFDVVGSHKCPTFTTQAKTVTPSAQAQTVTPDSGYDGLSSVAVSGDSNLTPANIKKDVSIFGVTGMMEKETGGIDTSDATATAEDIAKDKTAYVNGEKITGTLKKPGFSTTEVDYFVSSGTYAIPYVRMTTHVTSDGIFRTTDDVVLAVNADKYGNAVASDVAKGKTFTSKAGAKIEGTYEPPSTEPSLQAKSVTPSAAAQTVTPDTGYDGLSQVTVSGDTNLTAGNIKKGVNIFGVAGTYEAAASGGNGNNNCEAYEIDVTNPTVNFKTASGTIKVYGYAYATSSSGWGGSTTTVHAFCGDGYYTAANWGSPSKTSCTFGVSGGKLTGLPTLNGGTLLVVRGI